MHIKVHLRNRGIVNSFIEFKIQKGTRKNTELSIFREETKQPEGQGK